MTVHTERWPENANPLSPAAVEPTPRPRGRFRLSQLMFLVAYCAMACWVGLMIGFMWVGGLLGLLFAAVFGGAYIYAGRRSTVQDALLWSLAVTADRGMPLAPTFEAFASQCWGEYRRKLRAAVYHLQQGMALPEVLACEPRLFPREAEVLCRTAYDCGTLATALREACALRTRLRAPWVALSIRFGYLLWVLTILQMIGGFLAYFIMPKYEAIFADFGIPLPAITLATIDASHTIVRYAFLLLPLFLLQLGVLGFVTIAAVGVLPWDLPLVGRFFYRRHAALVLRCLAYVVETNRPMGEALERLERTYPSGAIADRLAVVAHAVRAGDDWCRALEVYGLIRAPELALLEAARRVGNLPWALRQAAENMERRMTYRFQLWVQWFLPLCVIAVGALVFVIIVAYFSPLVVLIEKLTS
jgi:protein transport protein HofC